MSLTRKLKKTGFSSLRRKPIRRKSTPEKLLKKKLWELCKLIIREAYGNECYTCGKTGLAGSSWHTGHFIASSICGLYLRYDLRNLRPQCYRCNIDLSGNGAVFYRRMVEDEGQEYVDELFRDKERITKSSTQFYQERILEYTRVLKILKE